MTISFHPEADLEFLEAIDYYESCQAGLGEDFWVEIHSTFQRILDFPGAWPSIDQDVRRCLAHRFPYGILYSIDGETVIILAVMNLRRDPDYWKHRR